MLKVGFIGLGNVGGKLAGSLLRNGVDLTVRDLNAAMTFYSALLNVTMTEDTTGPNPVSFFPYKDPAVAGHLYPGTPGRVRSGFAVWCRSGQANGPAALRWGRI